MNKFYTMFLASVATIGMLDASSTVSNASFASLLQTAGAQPTAANLSQLQSYIQQVVGEFNARVNMIDVVLPAGQQRWQNTTDTITVNNATPLIFAIISNAANQNVKSASFQMIMSLLEVIDLSTIDSAVDSSYGLNAMLWAIYYQNPAVVQLLLSRGANARATVNNVLYDNTHGTGLFIGTPADQLMGKSLNGVVAVPALNNDGKIDSVSPFIMLGMTAQDTVQAQQIASLLYNANSQVLNDVTDQVKMTGLMFMSANAMNDLISYLSHVPFSPAQLNMQDAAHHTAFDIANLANNEWRGSLFNNQTPSKQDYINTTLALEQLHA